MEEVKFECPHCEQPLEAPADMAGQLVACPKCGQNVEVAKVRKSPNVSVESSVKNECRQLDKPRTEKPITERRKKILPAFIAGIGKGLLWLLKTQWRTLLICAWICWATYILFKLQSDVVTVRSDVSSTKSVVWKIMPDVVTTKAFADTTFSDVRTVKYAVRKVKSDVDDIKSDVDDIKSELTSESDVGTIRSEVDDIRSDVGTVRSDVGTVRSDVRKVKSDVDDIKSDVDDIKRRLRN